MFLVFSTAPSLDCMNPLALLSALTDGSIRLSGRAETYTEHCALSGESTTRVTDVNGDIYTVVFVKTDVRPENAIDLPEEDPAMEGGMVDPQNKMPTPEEGFWPVPVTTGISDTYNAEIKEGIEAGTEVFTNRETNESYGY